MKLYKPEVDLIIAVIFMLRGGSSLFDYLDFKGDNRELHHVYFELFFQSFSISILFFNMYILKKNMIRRP